MSEISDQLREKLRRIAALAERGDTEGEREAARRAMDRVLKAAGIDPRKMGDPRKKVYRFKYGYERELCLLTSIKAFLASDEGRGADMYRGQYRKREIAMLLTYEDYITIHCAYEYFRRHMKAQHREHIEPHLHRLDKRHREIANNNFTVEYLNKSGLLDWKKVKQTKTRNGAETDAIRLSEQVEGGKYHRQMHTQERQLPPAGSDRIATPQRPAVGVQTSLF